MKRLIFLLWAGISLSVLHAQDAASEAGTMWKSGQAAFAAGDFPKAAASFSALLQKAAPAQLKWSDGTATGAPPPLAKWMEPAFYMLSASYYNAKEYPKAIGNFNRYFKLFPDSPRIAEVRFSMGMAQYLNGTPADAIPYFTQLLADPVYHEKCTMLLADANEKAGKLPDAIAVLEKEEAKPNLSAEFLGKMKMKLVSLYRANNQIEKAVALLQEIDGDINHIPDVTEFNSLAVSLGDTYLNKNQLPEALNCYRRVRDNAQVLAIEKAQIATLQKELADNLARIQADPLNSAGLQVLSKDLTAQIDKDQKILATYATLPPILPPLFLRIGRAYSVENHHWEAAVVYREVMRRFPKEPEAEPALYGMIVAFDKAKQTDRAQALCATYLAQYPQGKYADNVGFLRGVLAYDAQQFDQAIGFFEEVNKDHPDNPHREQIEMVLGDIKLRQQKFDDAIAAYAKYQKDFPDGSRLEQAEYRTALALLFGGKSEQANTAFLAYMKKYPDGQYVADAAYRLDVIKFASKLYDEVIAEGLAWQKKYGTAGPLAEVLSLMGDCYASTNRMDEAIAAYTRSYKVATNNDVLNYSLFAAAKLLQKQANWAAVVTMFQEFIKANPDSPYVVGAVSWIGRADVKLGKVDEAKQYMAETAKQYLNDPTREAVDEILVQLAQLYGKRHLAPLPVAGATTPVVADDAAKDLEAALTIPDLDKKPTAAARLLYAKSELARIQKKPEIEKQLLLEIASKYKPEDLSPAMLGQVGDCLVQNGQPDQADPYYHYLLDEYDQSPLVDFAYNGLGQIAYDKKDFAKALGWYSKALDKGAAASKLKEITLGQAQSLLALNRLDEARPIFEQVASNRQWRGEATALSVLSLGRIQMAQAKYAEANAFFQRVFVAYQKFPAIQAKAYLNSGEAFEKLGKNAEAVSTYNEMLRNPNLSAFPEAGEVKQRLSNIAQK